MVFRPAVEAPTQTAHSCAWTLSPRRGYVQQDYSIIEKEKHSRSRWNESEVMQMFLVLRLSDARFGNIDLERVVGQGIGIEHADRLICISLGGHGHKGEAF